MRQKFLIIPTQAFSQGVSKKVTDKKYTLDLPDFPWIVRKFIEKFGKQIMVILDEASWIKTNAPMAENKKSGRSQLIKVFNRYSEARCGLTGTLMTKSPVNILDPYEFLSPNFFLGESQWEVAERHCIMVSLRAARGRRVMIPQKEWHRQRKRMINAYKFGGESQLQSSKERICRELGITMGECEHILTSKTYSPFLNVDKLLKRVEHATMTVTREDIFDISKDKFVYDPIHRPVELGAEGKRLGNELVKLGFTDNIILGRAPALELMHRLKDICNGYEPVKDEYDESAKVEFIPLKENPKLEALKDLLEEIDVQKNQVVIWCSRRNAFSSVSALLEKEDIEFVSYSGSQKDSEKTEAEEKAANGEARVFVANPASAAFGLNCLRNFNYMIWYCIDASVERYHQAQHRILRGESKHPKFAYMVYVKGSVEERNLNSVNAGQELLSEANSKEIFEFT